MLINFNIELIDEDFDWEQPSKELIAAIERQHAAEQWGPGTPRPKPRVRKFTQPSTARG